MKKLFLLIIGCSLFSSIAFGQLELNLDYTYALPQQDMAFNIRKAHGGVLQMMYQLPQSRLAVGVELGWVVYGTQTERQTYVFSDGTQTETDVNVTNSFGLIALNSRYDFIKDGIFIPYANIKAGISPYKTRLYIEDPEDVDGCTPLENDVLQSDKGFYTTIGVGARLDLGRAFNFGSDGRLFLNFAANYTAGGTVKYMNVDKSTPQGGHQHHQQGDAEAFNAKFINQQTQVVHEHLVGWVYNSPIRMMDIRLGFGMRF